MADTERRGLLDELTSDLPLGEALASVLEALPDGILVVDLEGRIRQASGPLRELSGYDAEELVGKHVEILVPDDARGHHEKLRQGFADDPQVRSMGVGLPIDLRHRSGASIPVDISLSPITVGGARFVVAAVREAGPRREAEDLLRDALEREREVAEALRELDRMKDSFLRAVSHDLRSPLATMIGAAETLQARIDQLDRDRTLALVEGIIRGGNRLQTLLGDLLDLDRIRRGAVEVQRQQVDVAALLRQQVADLDPDGDRVEVDAPDTLAWAIDPSQLGRVIDNLVSNAGKHAPSEHPVLVGLDRVDDLLVLRVDDRGPGVDDDAKATIFRPFVRGASTASGTGVGLSLVAEFARLHGGRAWVEDRPGGGASFRVSFPAG